MAISTSIQNLMVKSSEQGSNEVSKMCDFFTELLVSKSISGSVRDS